jgi:hypothetical protein
MLEPQERGRLGEPRPWGQRLLLVGLPAVALINLWLFTGEQQSSRRLRVRAAGDIESLAVRAPPSVRHRHGAYYRLARELHGAALHMDPHMAELHRWALEGLGVDVRVARSSVVRTADDKARPLVDTATYRARLGERKLDVLLEPGAREYVMSWVGKGTRASILVVPLARFQAAEGVL